MLFFKRPYFLNYNFKTGLLFYILFKFRRAASVTTAYNNDLLSVNISFSWAARHYNPQVFQLWKEGVACDTYGWPLSCTACVWRASRTSFLMSTTSGTLKPLSCSSVADFRSTSYLFVSSQFSTPCLSQWYKFNS